MASSPNGIPTLDSFVKIGTDTFIRDPPKDASGAPSQPSVTIVMLFWMGASARNAAKYLAEYIKLAPQARIIFILTSPAQLFLRFSEKSRRSRVIPAVEALRASASSNAPMHFHIFSNGGAFTLRHMAISYQKATGKPLPAKALLIDSAPGLTSITRAHKALSFSFPKFIIFRILSSLCVWAGLFLGRFIAALARMPPPAERANEALNDPKLIDSGARRCYLYSEEDELIPWQDVENHANDAESKGYDVTLEKFMDSPHVSHMRVDPKRYWEIVTKYLAASVPLDGRDG